jgi:hypothetical protein
MAAPVETEAAGYASESALKARVREGLNTYHGILGNICKVN